MISALLVLTQCAALFAAVPSVGAETAPEPTAYTGESTLKAAAAEIDLSAENGTRLTDGQSAVYRVTVPEDAHYFLHCGSSRSLKAHSM